VALSRLLDVIRRRDGRDVLDCIPRHTRGREADTRDWVVNIKLPDSFGCPCAMCEHVLGGKFAGNLWDSESRLLILESRHTSSTTINVSSPASNSTPHGCYVPRAGA
jgi:hypothetical protein